MCKIASRNQMKTDDEIHDKIQRKHEENQTASKMRKRKTQSFIYGQKPEESKKNLSL